jgi:penicillin-binding protein 2
MIGNFDNSSIPRWRLLLTYAVMGVLCLLFLGRLFSLQVLQGEDYVTAAEDNRLETVNIPAPRGVIYDRNGSLLVRNIPVYNVVVTAAELPDSQAEQQQYLQAIADITGVPYD